MDNNAIFNISYGVYMLAAKDKDKANGCIINTCNMVALDPERVGISVQNSSKTCQMIKQTGTFCISILDETVTFQTIKHFGMQSGKNVDKFNDIKTYVDNFGNPYLGWQTCAMISCIVIESINLSTHTLFIAKVDDAKILTSNKPLTYADYQSRIKPKEDKTKNEKKIVAWRCVICGFVYEESELPDDYLCPLCGHGVADFEPVYGN